MTVACKYICHSLHMVSLDTKLPGCKESAGCIPDLQINDGCKKECEQMATRKFPDSALVGPSGACGSFWVGVSGLGVLWVGLGCSAFW